MGWEAQSGKLDPRPTELSGDSVACSTLREAQGLWLGTLSHVHGAQAANPTTLSSCPSDLATSGNDEGALTAQGGGEGEPRGQSPDTLLGNTDKQLNAGAAVTSSSAGAAPVAPFQREPRHLAMELGLWGTYLSGKGQRDPSPQEMVDSRKKPRVTQKKHFIARGQTSSGPGPRKEELIAVSHSQTTCGRPLPLAGLC